MRTPTINFAIAFVAASLTALSAARAADASREYLVKAAFIYNFMQFVQWPSAAFPAPDAPFAVAVVGDDPFDGALDRVLAQKAIGAHAVVVRHFASAGDIDSCQLLFVPAGQDAQLDAIFQKIAGKPVLTIGEDDAFIQRGCIEFFLEEKKIRFQINLDAINAASLKISAKLAKLARVPHR